MSKSHCITAIFSFQTDSICAAKASTHDCYFKIKTDRRKSKNCDLLCTSTSSALTWKETWAEDSGGGDNGKCHSTTTKGLVFTNLEQGEKHWIFLISCLSTTTTKTRKHLSLQVLSYLFMISSGCTTAYWLVSSKGAFINTGMFSHCINVS